MFKVKSVKETEDIIKKNFSGADKITIEVKNSLGYVLAEDIFALEDLPNFSRSTVDGYACYSKSVQLASVTTPTILKNVGSVKMGKKTDIVINDDETCYVPTGGMLPKGVDSVCMIENTEVLNDEIVINQALNKWQNVFRKGTDIEKSSIVFRRNTLISERHIGVMKALGIDKIEVFKKLKCFIISTGDELSDELDIEIGQIRDINTYTVENYIKEWFEITGKVVIADDFDLYKNTMMEQINENDIVITSGGSSVGEEDYTAKILESLGADILVHGINIKPGKPTIVAKVQNKLIWGLPGQPTSAYIVLNTFFDSVLNAFYGVEITKPYFKGKLTMNVPAEKGRRTYLLVNYDTDVMPIFAKSGMIHPLAIANGYIIIDEQSEGYEKGEEVLVYPFK